MHTEENNDQSAMRSRVESRNAPNFVPPVVKAATEPSKLSASTKIVKNIVPTTNYLVKAVTKAIITTAIVPTIVTQLELMPNRTSNFAIGEIVRLNPLRNDSNIECNLPSVIKQIKLGFNKQSHISQSAVIHTKAHTTLRSVDFCLFRLFIAI